MFVLKQYLMVIKNDKICKLFNSFRPWLLITFVRPLTVIYTLKYFSITDITQVCNFYIVFLVSIF